jgi:N6-adenosine-specific RNA methylase IME4
MSGGYVPAESHYPTMSTAELSLLDVRALAGDDTVLFCWATFPLLPDALEVIRAWGFKYKTAFVWDKGRPNFGNYHDASAELLIVATRGSGVPEIDERMRQIQTWPHPGEHSRKPEEARQMIDKLYPNGPRIELFRRGEAPAGWDVWGNEAADAA